MRRSPLRFSREVVDQLRFVAWPSLGEATWIARIVVFTLIAVIAFVLVLDFTASELIRTLTR